MKCRLAEGLRQAMAEDDLGAVVARGARGFAVVDPEIDAVFRPAGRYAGGEEGDSCQSVYQSLHRLHSRPQVPMSRPYDEWTQQMVVGQRVGRTHRWQVPTPV